MTSKELKKEMITFENDDICNIWCRLMKKGSLILPSAISYHYICTLDPEKILRRKHSYIMLRCQKCKDLFSKQKV